MLSILFEHPDVLAVNKPEGLAAIPERQREKDSLLSQAMQRYQQKLYVVHRLDKEASGVMLFARHAAAHRCLNDQFAEHSVHKTYLALLHGAISRTTGAIDTPIRQFGSGRMGIDHRRGQASVTEFRVLQQCGKFTLLQAYPQTGRRHQIRVHFYSIGHPIVGDSRYGDKSIQHSFPRLMLHARQITFRLPSGESTTIEAPLPHSFIAVLQSLGVRIK